MMITIENKYPTILHNMITLMSLVFMLILSGFAYAAPSSLEMFSGSATSSSGPTVAAQTSTVRLNANNPNDDDSTAFSPSITATVAFSNQQYTNVSGGAPNGNAMMFGANSGSGDTITGYSSWAPLNAFGNTSSSIFTSTATTTVGKGISATNNYGTQVFIATQGLQAANKSINGRHLMGTMTINYSSPIINPVIHLSGLGGTSRSGLGFSTEFDLTTSGYTLNQLSGSGELTVQSNKILNNASTISGTTGSGAASGSIQVKGGPVTTLTFNVYLRGDGNGGGCTFLVFCSSSYWDDDNSQAGDAFVISPLSLDAATDLSITKTQRVGTSGTFGATKVTVPLNSVVQYQLTINNNGSYVNGASFTDALPTELSNPTVSSSTCASATFSGNTLNGTFTGASGASCVVTIQATATSNADITNTATVSPPNGITDSVTTNNSASVETRLGSGSPATDVSISKTDGLDQVASGATTTYTLRVHNDGPNPVVGAILKDPAAAGLTKAGTPTCTSTPGNSCVNGAVPSIAQLESSNGYTLPSIPGNGGFYELTVQATVTATATSGSVTNAASVDVGNNYINSGAGCINSNNYVRSFDNTTGICTSTDTDTVLASNSINFQSNIREAALAISPNIPTIRRGAGGQQTITITNNGPDGANNTFATYTEQPTAGVAITSVTLSNGTVCNVTQTSPKIWKCPLGYLANGSSANFLVNYSTTTTANLNNSQIEGVVRAGSDELNPGSGVGESAYRIWGAETQLTNAPANSAFAVGFNRTTDTKVGGDSNTNTYGPMWEGSELALAWPANQSSPTGGYLKSSSTGGDNSTYYAATTNQPATVQRLLPTLGNISVKLNTGAASSLIDNRRGWEVKTGILVPDSQANLPVTACIGTSSQSIDDSAYIMLKNKTNTSNTILGGINGWQSSSYVLTVPITLQPGYNVLTYRIANRNGKGTNDGGELNAGGFGTLGLITNGSCLPDGINNITNVGENARINIIDAAALVITKTNNTDLVNAIGQTTYTLTVENQGPSDVTGAILKDPVATNMTKGTPVCSTIDNNQCTAATTPNVNQLEAGYALPVLASGQKYILSVPVTLNALTVSSVTNTASVKTPTSVTALGTACVNDTSSNITRSFDAASQTCTTSDTDKIQPRVQIAKTSIGNVGTFNFNVTNASTISDSVTTATAGTSVTSNVIHHVEIISNSLVINELSTTGFTLSSASCTDNNASISGNTTNPIGSLSNSTLTIDPTYLKPGANFVCSFTNSLKQITVSGRVFEDNSGTTAVNNNAYNGVQDAGETGIAGSKVQLKDSAGTVIAEVVTNATGDYTFNVSPENLTSIFTIVATNAADYTSVSGTSGSGGSYNLSTDTITLNKTTNYNYPNNNFGDAKLALVITPNNQQTTIAGGVVDYPHKISSLAVITMNSINSIAAQSPANSADQPWQSVIYLDSNCNGKVDVGETALTGTSTLNPVQSICVVHRVNVPINASAGAQQVVSLQANGTATSGNTPVTSNTVTDTTLVGSAGLDMKKGVRVVSSCPSTVNDTNAFVTANQARNGNFLEYEITYRNNSTKNLVDVMVKDSVPTGMVFKSQTCNTTPTGITCTPTQSGNSLKWSMAGKLPPATSGTVRYCVAIP